MFGVYGAIRGTQTRPHITMDQALKNLQEATDTLQKAHDDLEKAKEFHETAQDFDTTHEMKDSDLLNVIQVLERRIKNLEQREYDALRKHSKQSEELNKVLTQLGCGGAAGAVARTVVAPIDRVKILMQTQYVSHGGQDKYKTIAGTMKTILKEQGVTKLWRGNLMNVCRVAPYSATQFATYDYFKDFILNSSNSIYTNTPPSTELNILQRLTAGAMAGTAATTLTHPLDLIRLRLNVQPELRGSFHALSSILAEGGPATLFKGYAPTVMSLAPFIGINFAVFDTLKTTVLGPNKDKKKQNKAVILGLGATAGIIAQSICFPLDTVRRRMQMAGNKYSSTPNCFSTIMKEEGFRGFYKGMAPNAVKVIPNNAIRFMVFEFLKERFGK